MEHSFEYCALRYLLLWEQTDREIYESMQSDLSAEKIRSALHSYRVSRTFKGIQDSDKSGLILSALMSIDDKESLSPAEKVSFLVSEFSLGFGQANLSAATKLLWFRYRSPFVILDARAVAGLKTLKYKFNAQDYAEYTSRWHDAYDEHKEKVSSAVSQLSLLQPFVSTWHKSSSSIDILVHEQWFLERVFDIYLWEIGEVTPKNKRPTLADA